MAMIKAVYRQMGTGSKVNLESLINQIKPNGNGVQLLVGCDSQNISDRTIYVTTIVFRFPKNGAKVVYTKEKVSRISDMWTRLWNEAERSVMLATALKNEFGLQVTNIDLDYNTDPMFPSSKVYKAAKGYIDSVGFKSKAKPEMLIATWAANYLCS